MSHTRLYLTTESTKNRYALNQGRKTSFNISRTPFSWNLRFSALTTGELMRYNLKHDSLSLYYLKASAP